MSKTIIGKAKELVIEVGKEEAIEILQKRINEIGEPETFEDICKISAIQTAIEFIKDNK